MSRNVKKMPREYLTTGTIAEYCGVSKVTVLRWIAKGHLTAFRLPEGHYRVRMDDFKNFLAKHNIPVDMRRLKG